MSRKVALVIVEGGTVQDTTVVGVDDLEVKVVDYDDLDLDPDACRDLLDEIADLPSTDVLDSLRERLNSTIEEAEEDESLDDEEDFDEEEELDDEDDGSVPDDLHDPEVEDIERSL